MALTSSPTRAPVKALPNLQPRRLYQKIADIIVQFIEDGRYPIGSLIPPERELAKQLNVSRASVREALIALEVNGLVQVRVGSGVTVLARPSEIQMEMSSTNSKVLDWPDVGPTDVVAARQLIESETVAQAALVITEADLAELAELIAQMEHEHQQGLTHIAWDRRFHLKIAQISGNSALVKVLELLWDLRLSPMFRQFEAHFVTQSLFERTRTDHRRILTALTTRDPQQARAAMRAHLEGVEQAYEGFE